ncbi:oxidoreductase, partial [Xanthomonas campestris]
DRRHPPGGEPFCSRLLAPRTRLDSITNNACQPVPRPPQSYAHMMAGEPAALHDLPEPVRKLVGHYEGLRTPELLRDASATALPAVHGRGLDGADGLTRAAELSQVALLDAALVGQVHLFPGGRLDQDLQQGDLRGRNSRRLLLAEAPPAGMPATQLVNAIAPLIIYARLKPPLLRPPER